MGNAPAWRSVEAHGVQEGPATLLLEFLQQLIQVVLHVIHEENALAQLTEEERPQDGFVVVVLDIHVDDMHRLAGHLLPGIQLRHHLVVHSLFAGEDQVEYILAVLEPFWLGLDSLVSLQHAQNAVLRVEFFVFLNEIFVHLVIGGLEIINVGLVGCWSWKPHVGPCAKGPDAEPPFPKEVVGLHAPVLVTGAHNGQAQSRPGISHTVQLRCFLTRKVVVEVPGTHDVWWQQQQW